MKTLYKNTPGGRYANINPNLLSILPDSTIDQPLTKRLNLQSQCPAPNL